MTAAEARKKATEVLTNDVNSEYKIIKDMIMEHAGKGEYECWIYNTSIKSEVRVKLIAEGYKIGPTQSDRNESLTKINW